MLPPQLEKIKRDLESRPKRSKQEDDLLENCAH